MKEILILAIVNMLILICLLAVIFITISMLTETIPILIRKKKEIKIIKNGEAIRYINHKGLIKYYTPNDKYIPLSSDLIVLFSRKIKNDKKQQLKNKESL